MTAQASSAAQPKPPVPFTREEIEREGETFAQLVSEWEKAGIAVIVENTGGHNERNSIKN
jgi:hypothetical protein